MDQILQNVHSNETSLAVPSQGTTIAFQYQTKRNSKFLSNFDFCWEWKGCYCRFSCVLFDNIILLHTRGPVSPGGPGGPGVPEYPWNENTDGFHFHAIQKSNAKTISKGTQLKPTLYSVSYIASGKVIWIPESRKFWLVESGALA